MQIVRSGSWLYDEQVYLPVDIVSLDFDFWYEIAKADDQLEPCEMPQPGGPDGVLYYVRFRQAGSHDQQTWVDSGGHQTIEEAVRIAETTAPSPIR